MKKQIKSIKVLLLACLQAVMLYTQAQNLVPNPSFENITQCVTGASQFNYVTGWLIPNAPALSPDLFSTCASYTTYFSVPANGFGYQFPKQGNNYAGIVAGVCCGQENNNYREWIETKLADTLLPGKNYCVSFYVSLADSSGLAISNVGTLFSDSLITMMVHFPSDSLLYFPANIANPHSNIITDTMYWTIITGTYTPNSKKAYMVLGNLDTYVQIDTLRMSYINSAHISWQHSYYYIDMVSVTEIKPAVAKNDTTLALCDSLVLGANYDDNATYTWWPKTGMHDSTLANPTAQPSVTTTYYIKKVQCSSTTFDSIKIVVGACNVGIRQFADNNGQATIFPNPNAGSFNLRINDNTAQSNYSIKITDVSGILVKSFENIKDRNIQIDLTSVPDGFYLIKVSTANWQSLKKVIIQY